MIIIDPKTNNRYSVNSKEGKTLLKKYVHNFIKGGMEGSRPETYLDWETKIIRQIQTVYQGKIERRFDKQVLEFMIRFTGDILKKIVTFPTGTGFVRTCNSKNPLPNPKVTFMNCNARGNYKIAGSSIDSVMAIETTKPLRFADLTFISFILGCQIKSGKGDERGLFSSCCRIPDILEVCRKLNIDGIINFDSVDNVVASDFTKDKKLVVLKETLPHTYAKYIEQDMRELRATPSYNPESGAREYTYPEFVIVDHSSKIKRVGMLGFREFYSNEKRYAHNFNSYTLTRFDPSNSSLNRGSIRIGLSTLPLILELGPNKEIISRFVDGLGKFIASQVRGPITDKEIEEQIGLSAPYHLEHMAADAVDRSKEVARLDDELDAYFNPVGNLTKHMGQMRLPKFNL